MIRKVNWSDQFEFKSNQKLCFLFFDLTLSILIIIEYFSCEKKQLKMRKLVKS